MRGLQMEDQLMISSIIQHAAEYYGNTEIVDREMDGSIFRYTYHEAHERTKKLAQAITRLGVKPGERIGTLAWNTHRHFEMFYGISGTGAVLHTVNPRLFRDQLVYIINHCEDSWIFCDLETLALVEDLSPDLSTVKGFCLMADESDMPDETSLKNLKCYESLLDAESGDYEWPNFDEYTASTICYTSGTTGNPKGVVYSHRSAILSSMTLSSADWIGGYHNGAFEAMMPLAPMFHGNAWLTPYTCPMNGMKLVLPGRDYSPDKIVELLETEKCTLLCGVPTLWLILLEYLEKTGKKLPHLRASASSGSSPPRWMVQKLRNEYGVDFINTWGMTEGLGASKGSLKPGDGYLPEEELLDKMMKSGRGVFGIRHRIIDDYGKELPHDGVSKGDLQVRGPWIASGYFKGEGGSPLDKEDWLGTGDVATIDEEGYLTIHDRSKDVIKSGGEWISSIEIENIAAGHPDILQAAVIGVDHPRCQERPLLICVRREESEVDREELLAFLKDKIAKWWIPDDVQFIDQIPITGTGKIHKIRLREQFKDYKLPTT